MNLTCLQRYVLDGICRLRGRLGHNPHNDHTYIIRALHIIRRDAAHVTHAIHTLCAQGFLAVTNQRLDSEAAHDKRRKEEKREDAQTPAGLQKEIQVTTEDLDPLVISHKVIEELGLPVRATGLVGAIAGAIEFCLKNENGITTKQAAMEFLIAEGRSQLLANGGLDRFWFESQKWRKKRKPPETHSSGTIPSTELVEQLRRRRAEVAQQRARVTTQ